MAPRPEQKRKIANDVRRSHIYPPVTPPSNMTEAEYKEHLETLMQAAAPVLTPEQAQQAAKEMWDEFIEATDGKAKLEERAAKRREEEAEKRNVKKNIPIKKNLSAKDPRSRVPSGWDTANHPTTWDPSTEPMRRNLYRGKQSDQVIVDEMVEKSRPKPAPPPNSPQAKGITWDEQAKWEAVMQVWEDCKTLDYDEEDIGEMLYDVIASIVNGTYEIVTGVE